MTAPIRIGTRASKLALAQAQMLREALGVPSEIVAMTTAGDRDLHKNPEHWGYKGLFTKELEDAIWVTREEAQDALADAPGKRFGAPPPFAIAHSLLTAWVGG